MPTNTPIWLETALENLNHHGFSVIDNALSQTLCAQLRDDLRTSPLRAAAVGRGHERQLDNRIRRDATHWLDGNSDGQVTFLSTMESLRVALNQHFF